MTNTTIHFVTLNTPVQEAVVRFVEQQDGSYIAEIAGTITDSDTRMVRFMTRRLNKIAQTMSEAIHLSRIVERNMNYVVEHMGPEYILDIIEIQDAMNFVVDTMNGVFFSNDEGFARIERAHDLFDERMISYIVLSEAYEDLQKLVAQL